MFFSACALVHVFALSLDMKQQQQQPTKYRSNEFADLLIAALQTEEETSFTWPTTQLNITFKKVFDIVKEHDTSKGTITSNVRVMPGALWGMHLSLLFYAYKSVSSPTRLQGARISSTAKAYS